MGLYCAWRQVQCGPNGSKGANGFTVAELLAGGYASSDLIAAGYTVG